MTLTQSHFVNPDFFGQLLAMNPPVRIYSREHEAWWRRGTNGEGSGYTTSVHEAGIWNFNGAFAQTQHCGPEKGIEYEVVES